MIYRRIRPADSTEVNRLCQEHNIEFDIHSTPPLLGFVAEDSNDHKIIGVALSHQVALIEPFISDNPTTAVKLFYQLTGGLSAINLDTTIAHIANDNKKLADELERLGFKKINNKYSLYKKG
jgi:hypothetical protein